MVFFHIKARRHSDIAKNKSELQASERKSCIHSEAISGIKFDVLIAVMLQLLRLKFASLVAKQCLSRKHFWGNPLKH